MIHPPFTIAPVGKAVVGTSGMIDYAVWRGGELENTQLHTYEGIQSTLVQLSAARAT